MADEGRTAEGEQTMRRVVRVAVAACVALALGTALVPAAGAQKVLNPGAFSLVPTAGSIRVRTLEIPVGPSALPQCSDGIDNDGDKKVDRAADPQCSDPTDHSELAAGFQPKTDPSFNGTIDRLGNVSIPTTGIVIPPAWVPVRDPNNGMIYPVRASVQPTHAATGTLNPLTGAAQIRVRFRIRLEGNPLGVSLGAYCYIGTTTAPVDVNVLSTTGTGAVPYSPTLGTATLVNSSFSVPATNGCPVLVAPVVNSALGLPSPAGANAATLTGRTVPVIQRGLVARITTTPTLLSGPAPFTVRFDATTSTVARTPATYRWQFSDGTSATGTSVTKTFTTAGVPSVTLTVTDGDGDRSTAIKNVVVTAPA